MVFYKKNKNNTLLQELESVLDISGAQNYVPLYSRFFVLNSTNWNNINLENDVNYLDNCSSLWILRLNNNKIRNVRLDDLNKLC